MIRKCSEQGEREAFANTSSQYSFATSGSLMEGSTHSRWQKLKEGRMVKLDELSESDKESEREAELARLVQMNQDSIEMRPLYSERRTSRPSQRGSFWSKIFSWCCVAAETEDRPQVRKRHHEDDREEHKEPVVQETIPAQNRGQSIKIVDCGAEDEEISELQVPLNYEEQPSQSIMSVRSTNV